MVLEEKKNYDKPSIDEFNIILTDIIALSNQGVLGDIFNDDGERLGD